MQKYFLYLLKKKIYKTYNLTKGAMSCIFIWKMYISMYALFIREWFNVNAD